MVLLIATIGGVGYLLVGRSSGGGTTADFVHLDQEVAQLARRLPVEAQRVQRFVETGAFEHEARFDIATMQADIVKIQGIAVGSTGSGHQIAEAAITAGHLAVDAGDRYLEAVVFSYRLSNADAAAQDLAAAATTLDQQATAWSHK